MKSSDMMSLLLSYKFPGHIWIPQDFKIEHILRYLEDIHFLFWWFINNEQRCILMVINKFIWFIDPKSAFFSLFPRKLSLY